MTKFLKLFLILPLLSLLIGNLADAQTQGLDLGMAKSVPSASGCSQATQFTSRLTNSTWSSAYTTMICAMVADGSWAKLDGLWILATSVSTDAVRNLVSSSFPFTAAGGPTFTANTGYVGTGTGNNLTNTYNFSTGTNFTQNSAFIAAWSTQGTNSDNGQAICDGGSFATFLQTFTFGSAVGGTVNSGSAGVTNSVATGTGFTHLERGSTILTVYKNGVSLGNTTSTGPSTPVNQTMNAACGLAQNLAVVALGGGMGATIQASFYSDLHTFLHTVNAASFP